MRYRELYETDPAALGLHRLVDRSKPTITLRDLNRLKKIRNTRLKALRQKEAFLPQIYGDPDMREDEHDLRQRELEQIKDEIGVQIDRAEIDADAKAHIADMALKAINKAD